MEDILPLWSQHLDCPEEVRDELGKISAQSMDLLLTKNLDGVLGRKFRAKKQKTTEEEGDPGHNAYLPGDGMSSQTKRRRSFSQNSPPAKNKLPKNTKSAMIRMPALVLPPGNSSGT